MILYFTKTQFLVILPKTDACYFIVNQTRDKPIFNHVLVWKALNYVIGNMDS